MSGFNSGGLWGKFFIFCRIQLEFRLYVHKRNWRISCKFQFEKLSSKKLSPKSRWQTYMKWKVDVHVQFCPLLLWRHFRLRYSFDLFPINSSYVVISSMFCDIFFITVFFFELKLTWYASMFFIKSETKFQLDPTKDKEFPHRPPL